ncbi:glycosyltransferase [Actinosynnema sp. NPDC059797]
MRVLFTSTPTSGHLHPLVPLAAALRDRGHEVAFACAANLLDDVRSLGFAGFAAGLSRDGDGDEEFTALKAGAKGLTPGVEMDRLAIARVMYGVRARRTAADLVPICREWRPDVLVRDSYEPAAAAVGELLDIPCASVDITPLYDTTPLVGDIAEEMDRLRAEVGLPPGDGVGMLHRYLHLCFALPRLLDPARPMPPITHHLRDGLFDNLGDQRLPPHLERLGERPLVYVSFGTVAIRFYPGAYPGLMGTVLDGLADLDADVVATVGHDRDPADLGPRPANVHVERYLPQSLLLSRCSAVVNHGGFNTMTGAMVTGLPQVSIPLLTDDHDNVRRFAALGLTRALDAATTTPGEVRSTVLGVLGDQAMRADIEKARAEMAELPGPDHAVDLLERLAVERVPLRSGS